MTTQVLQEDLIKALNAAVHFINTKMSLPILGNFLLETQKTKLKIKATNLEMSVSVSIGAKVDVEGSITVPAKTFLELVTNLQPGQVNLELEKGELKIKTSDFSASLPTIPSNDFPAIPEEINSKDSFTIPTKDLTFTLSKVLFSTSLDETRPILTGVLFIFKDTLLSLVSSDGFRLSRKNINLPKKIPERQIVVPRSSLLQLIRLSNESENLIFEVRSSDNQLIIKVGETVISSRLIEGTFPDFEKIIPSSSGTKVTLDKNDLGRGVSLAAIFARESGNVIKLSVKENFIELTSQGSKTGNQKTKIEGLIVGSSLDISFNYKFLEDFINTLEGESIEINLTDSVSPAIFVDPKDEKFLHLIMPVRIQN